MTLRFTHLPSHSVPIQSKSTAFKCDPRQDVVAKEEERSTTPAQHNNNKAVMTAVVANLIGSNPF